MKEWLVQMLMPLADWLLSLVLAVPLGVVRIIFLGLLAVLALWVITLPPQLPAGKDEEEGKRWQMSDLRLFAVGLLALQSILYLIF